MLILLRLRWDLSATTPLDFLDHILPRLALPSFINLTTLRRKTENIIAWSTLDYHFCYKSASLIAATAIFTAVRCCIADKPKSMTCLLSEEAAKRQDLQHEKLLSETKRCLQILTLAGGDDLDACCLYLAETLPEELTGHERMGPMPVSPDSTMARTPPPSPLKPLDGVSSTSSPTPNRFPEHLTSTPSRGHNSTPDFYSAMVQVVLNPTDAQMSSSILCS